MSIPLSDTSELVSLCESLRLFLKPMARINISVTLPQLKDPGQSISNWDLMERIKKAINPIQFTSIKVATSTIEFVRFEADVDNRRLATAVIKQLDGTVLKVIGFYETLKVRACEARTDFPARVDWDTFFRDAKTMNELLPGQRPDTIYLANLPVKWFADEKVVVDVGELLLPSETVFRLVMEKFGEVRCVDIPLCDPYRKDMSRTGIRSVGFSFGRELVFEGYVQYVEYISFLKAMDQLRNMRLVKFDENGKAHQAQIKVDFDRTKHLSDKSIRRRRLERERLIAIEQERQQEEKRLRDDEDDRKRADEHQRDSRRAQREETRRLKRLEKRKIEEEKRLEGLIVEEERKLALAQRKLQSRRLLSYLFDRISQKLETSQKASSSLSSDNESGELHDDDDAKVKKEEEADENRSTNDAVEMEATVIEKRLRQQLLDDRERRLREKMQLKYAEKRKHKRKDKHSTKSKKHHRRKRRKTSSESGSDVVVSESSDSQQCSDHFSITNHRKRNRTR